MTIEVFLRLLKQNLLWFILIPCLTAGTAYLVTRNEHRVYRSQATLYTGLVSRYSLMTDRAGNFSDRSAGAFDNILTTLNSRETLLQIGTSLLTDHLRLRQPDTLVLAKAGFDALHKDIPPKYHYLFAKSNDPVVLHHTIDSLAKTPVDNPIKALLLTSKSYYSIRQLGEMVKATARKGTNDVLLMEYESDDPAVSQQTLHYAIDILKKRYSKLKTTETNSVLGYYEAKLDAAKVKLSQAESALRAFSEQHQVLNYEEEARNVAASREALGNEYNQELMRKNAAKASLDALNKRMGQQSTVQLANNDLIERQKKLADAEKKLANARAYGQPRTTIAQLQAGVNEASEDLKTSAQKYDAAATTTDALPTQTMANDRLAKSLEYEESEARLKVYQKQMNDYQAKTNEYGPLGSALRRLNRNLEIAEKEYVQLLQSVEQSQTRRQDVAIGGTLEVLDAPDFPLTPQPSKRWQMVIIGFGVGMFLALLLTALRFLLDKRIHSPEQAETLIGMPITALFPMVKKPQAFTKATMAARSMFERLFNAINVEVTQNASRPYPPIITLFSIRSRQGKTWVANGLLELYGQAEQQVAYCYPRVTGKEQQEQRGGITYFPYTIRPDFMNVTGIDYLVEHDQKFDITHFDRVFLEVPPLINSQIPIYLVKSSALSLLVMDASSGWARTENQLLNMYVRVTKQPILAVLNRVEEDEVDVLSRVDAVPPAANQERSLQVHRDDM